MIAVLVVGILALNFLDLSKFVQSVINNPSAIVNPSTNAGPDRTTTTTQATTTERSTTTQTGSQNVQSGESTPSQVTLEIKSWGFNPDTVSLVKGSTASWTNKDSVKHTITGEGYFDSKDIQPGATWSYTFNTPGTYKYSCKYSGFMGTVVIE
ncbi:MAG: cupredoxin domain-containing protein [Candidatus Aenigmatarchaeota archaeon]